MFKILKNLKESFVYVLIIVMLLVLQAWADLTLPDFTSKIVNTGIQAGGVENAVPKIISKEYMEMLLQLTDDKDSILDNYMINGSVLTADQQNTIKTYLGEEANPEAGTLYILRDIDSEKEEELSNKMSGPLTVAAALMTTEIPEEQKMQVVEQTKTQVSQMQDSIKEQTAVTVVKELYKLPY